jgi:hypothetical protein
MGTASDYSLVLWTTAGDGMFSNTSSVSTLYTPGTGDKAAGYAQLTLTAFPLSPCPNSASDIMLLGLLTSPEISLQPISQSVYSGDDVVFEVAATGSGTITYQWFGPAGLLEDENGTQLLLSQVSTADAGNYYCVATNSCGSETSSPATLTVTDLPVQNIQIPDGWSGISSYLDIQNPMVANMFSPVTATNSLIILQNYSTMYWPAEQINTIDQTGGWDAASGYQIKVTGNQVLPVSGIPLQDKTLDYPAGGWYLMPVLNECGVAPEVLFAAIPGKVVIVKEIAGMRVYWPGVFQNLMVLEPAKAYTTKFTEAVTFAYPDCGGVKNYPSGEVNNELKNIVPGGPNSHVIVIEGKVTSALQKGDQINISTNSGKILGSIILANPGETLGLQVFEDDPTTLTQDGFLMEDEMIFTIVRNDQIFDLKPLFDEKWDQHLLKNNGMSLVKSAAISPSGTNQAGNIEISFYPNPSINQIIFGGIETPFQVSIFNSEGQKVVDQLQDTPQMDISKLKPGMYNVRVFKGALMTSKKFIKE